ncbi:MAG: hypothetical protein KH703_05905 [Campylobacter gracilis]|uniref:hypothetical protein n=1 Tax=Campylobacter gracilis TaxID=824 RepID=UPI0026EC6D5B|nr:hypothetical protein [Campylobacter gracilis]MBS6152927.1 hypothetical protein [Campylobacter gracilis]
MSEDGCGYDDERRTLSIMEITTLPIIVPQTLLLSPRARTKKLSADHGNDIRDNLLIFS